MGCFSEVLEAPLKNDIAYNANKQSLLIEFILTHSSLDLNDLAELVNVNVIELSHVLAGKSFLPENSSSLLLEWFMILTTD